MMNAYDFGRAVLTVWCRLWTRWRVRSIKRQIALSTKERSLYKCRYFKSGNYFAFYVDLLGQKEFYSRLIGSGDALDPVKEYKLRVVNSVTRKVFKYTGVFLCRFAQQARFSYELNRKAGFVKYAAMSVEDYEEAVAALEYGTQQFSDSLMFYLRDDGFIAGDVFPFCVCLLSRLTMEYFPNELAFRGALSYGRGWESGKNVFTGPLLDELMQLEETEAVIPRVIIGDRLLQLCKKTMPSPLGMRIKWAHNLIHTIRGSIILDEDGMSSLDVFSSLYRMSLQPCELAVHRDLLVASCKFLYDQWRMQSGGAAQSDGKITGNPSVALKYYKAYERHLSKLPEWGVPPIDFSKSMQGYKAAPENYEGNGVVLSEYAVIRLAFNGGVSALSDEAISLSRRVERFNREMQFVFQWVKRHKKMIAELLTRAGDWGAKDVAQLNRAFPVAELQVQQFASVAIVSVKCPEGLAELLRLLLIWLSVKIVRTMSKGTMVEGSIVSGLGWQVCSNCLCGPVMQESYELHQKVSCTPRILFSQNAGKKLSWCRVNDVDGNPLLDNVKLYGYYAILRNEQRRCLRDVAQALRFVSGRKMKVEKRLRWTYGISERYLSASLQILKETLREMNGGK